jgi:transposase-like protein
MTATRRRYTRKQKAETVAKASMTSVAAAAQETGIHENTIRYWMDKPEFVELRTKTDEDVKAAMWATMQLGIERIAELIPETEDIAKVGVAVGILYDKRALMAGDPTGRTETTITGGYDDHEKAALRDAIDSILEKAGEAAEAGAGGDPV